MFEKNSELSDNVLTKITEQRDYIVYAAGIYSYFLPRWMKVFPPDQFFIVNGKQFLDNPGKVIESVQKFLSVPLYVRKSDFFVNNTTGLHCLRALWSWKPQENILLTQLKDANEEGLPVCTHGKKGRTRAINSKNVLKSETENMLMNFYKPYNKRLFDMIDMNWNWDERT